MFNGKEGEVVTLEEAQVYTKRYNSTIAEDDIKAVSFGKENLENILIQNECIGVRFYYAKTEEDKLTLVAVGYNADGDDLSEGIILERGAPCPPYCAMTLDLS